MVVIGIKEEWTEMMSQIRMHGGRIEPRAGSASSKRSGLEILVSMVSASMNGIEETYMMQRANVSYSQLQYYLPFLVRQRLVMEAKNHAGVPFYKATERGSQFIMDYEQFSKYLDSDLTFTD